MQGLVLRDIHQPPAPPWWPPAPGWWLVFAVVALVLLAWGYLGWRKRRRRRAVIAVFDAAVSAAGADPAAEIAALSALLRRAALRRSREAATLDGEAWLAFLDGGVGNGPPRNPPSRTRPPNRLLENRPFSTGPGRLLLDGGFRRDVDPALVPPVRALARERFVEWMAK